MHSMSHTSLPITRYSINPCPCTCPRLYALAPCAEVSVLNVHRDCVSASRPACLLTFPPEPTRIYIYIYFLFLLFLRTNLQQTFSLVYFIFCFFFSSVNICNGLIMDLITENNNYSHFFLWI